MNIVKIQKVDRGFIVRIGCKTIATSVGIDGVLDGVKEYFLNPEKAHRAYFPEDFLEKDKVPTGLTNRRYPTPEERIGFGEEVASVNKYPEQAQEPSLVYLDD